ncbi:unnamed protein product, partial [Trichogramma brassicae]
MLNHTHETQVYTPTPTRKERIYTPNYTRIVSPTRGPVYITEKHSRRPPPAYPTHTRKKNTILPPLLSRLSLMYVCLCEYTRRSNEACLHFVIIHPNLNCESVQKLCRAGFKDEVLAITIDTLEHSKLKPHVSQARRGGVMCPRIAQRPKHGLHRVCRKLVSYSIYVLYTAVCCVVTHCWHLLLSWDIFFRTRCLVPSCECGSRASAADGKCPICSVGYILDKSRTTEACKIIHGTTTQYHTNTCARVRVDACRKLVYIARVSAFFRSIRASRDLCRRCLTFRN